MSCFLPTFLSGRLREYNEDIRLTALRPGDVLCVPPSGDRGLCENGGPVYRLQEGDTLDEIAERNGTNVEQLLRLNPNLLPSDFVSGQVIVSADKAARNRGKHGRAGTLIYITKRSGPCGFAPFCYAYLRNSALDHFFAFAQIDFALRVIH